MALGGGASVSLRFGCVNSRASLKRYPYGFCKLAQNLNQGSKSRIERVAGGLLDGANFPERKRIMKYSHQQLEWHLEIELQKYETVVNSSPVSAHK